MAKTRDRTEDFKDAVHTSSVSSGYPESKLALVMASFIMRKPTQRLPFTKASLKTLESINELEHFIVKHQKDYLNVHRTTEQERDNIEHEVSVFVKASKEQIDILKNRIYDEEKHENATRWLPMLSDGSHADEVAHKHGVVLILSERLHSVTSKFDQLRSIRIQDAINRAMPRRKKLSFPTTKSREVLKSDFTELEGLELSSEPIRVQNQLLDDETLALQVELSSLLDAVQETETKMVEMSALNHLMSTHVLQQAQQIELLYEQALRGIPNSQRRESTYLAVLKAYLREQQLDDASILLDEIRGKGFRPNEKAVRENLSKRVQAVEATKNVELGNKELTQAIQRSSGSRTFLLLFLFVLTFSVLFLDWYS